MAQPTLRWPIEDQGEVERKEERKKELHSEQGVLVMGCSEEDGEIYRTFLMYCEKRRLAYEREMDDDEERKREAIRKEANWSLLKESMSFLKENEDGWQQRRIKEVDRIKEEEKRDRLAICKEKNKMYDIQKLSKEENRRLKERTEERIMISKAKANYWKKYRSMEEKMNEDRGEIRNEDSWKQLKNGIQALEERGGWIEDDDALEKNVTGGERVDKNKLDGPRAGEHREKTGVTDVDMDDMVKVDN